MTAAPSASGLITGLTLTRAAAANFATATLNYPQFAVA